MAIDISDTNIEVPDEILNINLSDDNKEDNLQTDITTNVKGVNKTSSDDEELVISLKDDNNNHEVVNNKSSIENDESEFNWKDVVRFAIDNNVFTDITEDELSNMDNSINTFSNIIQKELEIGIKEGIKEQFNIINQKSEGLIEHILNGGNISDYVQVAADDYSTIKDEDLNNNAILQEKLVRNYYKNTTNWSESKINKFIERHKDLDELKDEALTSLNGLKDIQKERKEQLMQQTQAQKIKQEQSQKQRIENIQKTINDTKEFIGINITPKIKSKIQDNIMNDKTFLKINNNIDKYRINLAILDELGLLDGNPDNIKKILTDKATKEVKQSVAEYDFKRSTAKQKRDNDINMKSIIDSIDIGFNKFNI